MDFVVFVAVSGSGKRVWMDRVDVGEIGDGHASHSFGFLIILYL